MEIIIAGGSGFIGRALGRELVALKHKIILLTRDMERAAKTSDPSVTLTAWDGKSQGPWTKHIKNADAVINLTGEGIANKKWTTEQKNLLISSRLDSTKALIQAMKDSEKKPSVFINASAVGYYGNVPEGDVPEARQKGSGFLADLCDQWEKEANQASSLGIRVSLMRIGIVLEKEGGALTKMLPPFQFFVGGPLGSGSQWFPWIHRDDVIGMIIYALLNPNVSGPINTTAPNPLRMKDFCSALGKAMGRPSWAPVPDFALRLLLGDMAEMLLGGQKAIPKRMLELGYTFKYPEALGALQAILKR